MARRGQGRFSITKLKNGKSPITGNVTRPVKIFAALEDGSVVASEFHSFKTDIVMYEGTGALAPSAASSDAAMANSSYRLSDNDSTSSGGIVTTGSGFPDGSTYTVVNNTKSVTVTAPNTSLSSTSAREGDVEFKIRVKTENGVIVTSSLYIDYSKQQDGTGGQIVQLVANKLSFSSNFSGTLDASQDDVIIDIYTQGNPGAQRYYTSIDGASFVEKTTVGAGEGEISGFDHDYTGDFTKVSQRATITCADDGTFGLEAGDVITLTLGTDAVTYTVPTPIPAVYNLSSVVKGLSSAVNAHEKFTTLSLTSTTFDVEAEAAFVLTESNTGTDSEFTATVGTFSATAAATIDRTAKRLTISQTNLGDNDNFVIKVTGASDGQGNDILSIIKNRRGLAGANAISTTVESNDGGHNFAPGADVTRTLTATAYDQGTGLTLTTGLIYTWRDNNSDGDAVTITALTPASSRTVDSAGVEATGADVNSIIVDQDDALLVNGWVCVVTET